MTPYTEGRIVPQNTAANRDAFYQTIGSLAGRYGPNDVNALAQQYSDNPFGVSFQELQGTFANGANTGRATTGGGGVVDSNALRSFDQSINNTQSAIDRLGSQLNSGYSGIDSSYQNAINQLLGGKNQGERNYDENVKTTRTNYIAGKNTVGANAGSTLNSLQRLMGARGAGGSSAYEVAGPQAVSRQATLQRNDLSNTFGANIKGLDQSWGDFMQGYNNQVSGAGHQRDQQKSELQRQIDNNRASLLQSLAQLAGQRDQVAGGNGTGASQPYLDQANSILDRTANYTTSPINYSVEAYKAPSLSSYTTNPNAAPTYQGQKSNTDYFSPYLAALLGKKQTNKTG